MEPKIKMVCESCRYRFTRPKGWGKQLCPFCGKNGSVHEELSVADLVDDIENLGI